MDAAYYSNVGNTFAGCRGSYSGPSNDGAHQTGDFPIRKSWWWESAFWGEMLFPTRHDRAGNSPSIRDLKLNIDPICRTSYKPPCQPVRLLSELALRLIMSNHSRPSPHYLHHSPSLPNIWQAFATSLHPPS